MGGASIRKASDPTHNDLLAAFYRCNLSEVQGMNLLTRQQLISDNAAHACDVATADIIRSIEFLKSLEP